MFYSAWTSVLATLPKVSDVVKTTESGKLTEAGNQAVGLANEGFTIIFKIGIVGLAISLVAGILFLAFSNTQTRDQHKTHIIIVIACCIGFFAVLSFMGLAQRIGSSLFDAPQATSFIMGISNLI